jgi:hypothetical protein
VADGMKRQRAEKIATALSDNERWHSHGRGISMQTLRNELNLRIDDFDQISDGVEVWLGHLRGTRDDACSL